MGCFYLFDGDKRKKEFVGVRMERQLFIALKTEADKRNTDLSTTIRSLCSEVLNVCV